MLTRGSGAGRSRTRPSPSRTNPAVSQTCQPPASAWRSWRRLAHRGASRGPRTDAGSPRRALLPAAARRSCSGCTRAGRCRGAMDVGAAAARDPARAPGGRSYRGRTRRAGPSGTECGRRKPGRLCACDGRVPWCAPLAGVRAAARSLAIAVVTQLLPGRPICPRTDACEIRPSYFFMPARALVASG